MMNALQESAVQARDNCVKMSLCERLNDALPSINLAIQLYPIEAEFHLQRWEKKNKSMEKKNEFFRWKFDFCLQKYRLS